MSILQQHVSSLHSPVEIHHMGYGAPLLRTLTSRPLEKTNLPLDPIHVPALNLEELAKLDSGLASLLAPIRSASAFKTLLVGSGVSSQHSFHSDLSSSPAPSHFSQTLPRYAPLSLPHLKDWELPLMSEGIVTPCPRSQVKAMLSCFSVPKANGKVARLILNASKLNACCQPPPHFSLPSIFSLRDKLFRFRQGLVFDLRHCFTQFPVAPAVARYFCFRTQRGVFSFRRLAMGWSWSACIAQSAARSYIAPVAEAADAIYDDFVVLGDTGAEALANAQVVRDRMRRVGATEHPDKSMDTPSHIFVYMGAQWDLQLKRHRLAPAFVEKWKNWFPIFRQGLDLTLRMYWVALGALLYVQRTLMVPGCSVWPLFEWASVMAKQLATGLLWWTYVVRPWSRFLECMYRIA
jgi:hypothetical protein